MASSKRKDEDRVVVDNRKARHAFEVLESVEAGISLVGTEVKTLRQGIAHLDEAYARFDGGELFLVGAHIAEYSHGNVMNHLPTRKRKLLLRKSQLKKLAAKVQQKGLTLVPMDIHFSARGYAKITLGLCRGRKLHDKRQKQANKEAARELRDH